MTLIYVILIGGMLAYLVGHILESMSKSKNNTKMNIPTKNSSGNVDKLILQTKQMTRKAEALIQANLSGHETVANAINTGSYTGPLPEKRSDGGWLSIFDNLRILKIAGINHRPDIGRYVGRVECALVPEPSNEFDPYAIKVVAEDSHHLGYIPSDMTDFVRSLTANEFPYRCTAFIREADDETDGHLFFVGFVYIKRLD